MQSKPLSFNEDAELYDKVRPGYPKQLFIDLQKAASLDTGSTILEVGCGTGQATKDLVEITKHVTCIDPGANLLRIAEDKFPELTFVKTTLEDFAVNNNTYDLILSATAWHWVDPAIGYKKAAKLLKQSGHLAILHNYHIETSPEAFHNKAQFIYNKYSGHSPKLASRQPIDDMANKLENQYFQLVKQLEYPWEQTYGIDEYIALRNTYSDHRTMEENKRLEFEAELREFAEKEFNGKITKQYTAVLFLAQKKL